MSLGQRLVNTRITRPSARTGRSGGFLAAGGHSWCYRREKKECPAEGENLRRAESAASGRKVASVCQRGAPAPRDPFLKRPCTERVDAPRPARRPTEAYPPRYGEDGQRSRRGCSDPRMPGSEGMDLWRPASPCAEWPSVPGYPGGGSVRQPICQTLR